MVRTSLTKAGYRSCRRFQSRQSVDQRLYRWEMKDSSLFLRTAEFLWQEGHTASLRNEEEAIEEQPVLVNTICISHLQRRTSCQSHMFQNHSHACKICWSRRNILYEALMQAGKALPSWNITFLGPKILQKHLMLRFQR